MHKEKRQQDIHMNNVIDSEKTVKIEPSLTKNDEAQFSEEEISGNAANVLHDLLENPDKNPARERMITAAIHRFPHPGQPTTVDIEL